MLYVHEVSARPSAWITPQALVRKAEETTEPDCALADTGKHDVLTLAVQRQENSSLCSTAWLFTAKYLDQDIIAYFVQLSVSTALCICLHTSYNYHKAGNC